MVKDKKNYLKLESKKCSKESTMSYINQEYINQVTFRH